MSEQYRRGLEEIVRLNPLRGESSIKELTRICPEFTEYFVEFGFGEIYARKVLDAKTKALIGVSSLIGIGHNPAFLKAQILGAWHSGCTREEITETIIQSIFYSGFPPAFTALKVLVEVFADITPADKSAKSKQRKSRASEKGPAA